MTTSAPFPPATLKVPHTFRVLCLSGAILLLGFWLRFYQLPEVPFGWHVDESAHGLEARDLLRGGELPVFFSQFTGHEALYTYLVAGAFLVWGQSVWAGRLVSAFAGALTVALTIPLGQMLWPGARGRRVGQWAALLLAVSLWHLIASRNVYRAILEPLLQIPAMLFLLIAIRRTARKAKHAWVWWALAGFFVGLNIHTYLAARAFPLVIGLVALAALWPYAQRWHQLRGLALAGFVAALVVLPLAIHFYFRPIDLYGRGVQISIWTSSFGDKNPWVTLWHNLVDTANMFMHRGDPSYKFNLGDAPVFDPGLGVLFWLGVAGAGLGLFRRRSFLASTVLLGWLAIMQLPMVLSAQGIPHYVRAIGALPIVMFFPALIIERAWTYARQFLEARTGRRLGWLEFMWLAPCLWLTANTYQAYFHAWNDSPYNDAERVVQMFYLEKDLRATWTGEPLYLATAYAEHVTLAFLNPPLYEATHGFNGSQALPLPPEGSPPTNYYYLNENTNARSDTLWRTAGLQLVRTGLSRLGLPAYEVYRWPGRWPQPAFTGGFGWSWDMSFPAGWAPNPIAGPVNFSNTVTFRGYDLNPAAVVPGQKMELVLHWLLPGPAEREYSMFAHVLDENSQVVAQSDSNLYPALHWHAGELLLSDFPLTLPPGTPPGRYQLEIGVYYQPTGERLAILQAGQPVADRLLLQPLVIR